MHLPSEGVSPCIAPLLRHRFTVLGEWGFIPFSATGAHLTFQFCSALCERVTMTVTANLHFTKWTQIFGDGQLTTGFLDRLTHHAHILRFIGESYRFHERMEREAADAER